ncbi:MAG: hypothetical protein AB7P04_05980 [Bacteriovoracia bacterium]
MGNTKYVFINRAGFSLVELMIGIAGVGALSLLSASLLVQNKRGEESSRRMASLNNDTLSIRQVLQNESICASALHSSTGGARFDFGPAGLGSVTRIQTGSYRLAEVGEPRTAGFHAREIKLTRASGAGATSNIVTLSGQPHYQELAALKIIWEETALAGLGTPGAQPREDTYLLNIYAEIPSGGGTTLPITKCSSSVTPRESCIELGGEYDPSAVPPAPQCRFAKMAVGSEAYVTAKMNAFAASPNVNWAAFEGSIWADKDIFLKGRIDKLIGPTDGNHFSGARKIGNGTHDYPIMGMGRARSRANDPNKPDDTRNGDVLGVLLANGYVRNSEPGNDYAFTRGAAGILFSADGDFRLRAGGGDDGEGGGSGAPSSAADTTPIGGSGAPDPVSQPGSLSFFVNQGEGYNQIVFNAHYDGLMRTPDAMVFATENVSHSPGIPYVPYVRDTVVRERSGVYVGRTRSTAENLTGAIEIKRNGNTVKFRVDAATVGDPQPGYVLRAVNNEGEVRWQPGGLRNRTVHSQNGPVNTNIANASTHICFLTSVGGGGATVAVVGSQWVLTTTVGGGATAMCYEN